MDDPNDTGEEPSFKWGKYIKPTHMHFKRLMATCNSQQTFISLLLIIVNCLHIRHVTPMPNLKRLHVELSSLYDSSEDQLIPFLSHLDIWCQNEGWPSATYVQILGQTYDLTSYFASVQESDITCLAEARSTSPMVNADKHTVDHATYNSCLLAIMIMNSITDNLLTTLLNHIPHKICNDGTYLLWSLSNNIHHINVSFTKYVQDV